MLFGLFIAVTSFNLLVMYNEMYNKPLINVSTNIYTNASYHNRTLPLYNKFNHKTELVPQQDYILNISEFKPSILYRLDDKPYYKDLVIYKPRLDLQDIYIAIYFIRLMLLVTIIYCFWII